ncbi:MAG: DUF86 domain-containing protein [Rhizobiaceae bacterium]
MKEQDRALRLWLEDIVAWGRRLATYVSTTSEGDFLVDNLRQDAVVRCLECIGEASRRVMSFEANGLPKHIEFLEAYWARNRFAHGYFDLDMSRVWLTATVSAPKLVADVEQLLKTLPDPHS